jgi:selenocysteine lyase/cysteine desulfurase
MTGDTAVRAPTLAEARRLFPAAESWVFANVASRSHIITIGTLGAGDAYTSEDARLNKLAEALKAAKVQFTGRRGLVRFGFHLYNDDADVDRILEVARARA